MIKFTETDVDQRKRLARHAEVLREHSDKHNYGKEIYAIQNVLKWTNAPLPKDWFYKNENEIL